MSLERVMRFFKEPVLLMVGVRRAPVDSELARNDFRELLRKAKRLVRYAAEQVKEPDLLSDLVNRGVKLQLIVGKSQDSMLLARLQSKGVMVMEQVDVWRLERKILSPFVIVDGTHTMRCDREDEMIPGRAEPRMQNITLNNTSVASIYDGIFKDLLRLSTK